MYKKNYYIALRLRILISILFKKKLSFTKIVNGIQCFVAYWLKRKRTAPFPFMITFDLSNECNLRCAFCRTTEGNIYNRDPTSTTPIAKGHMDFALFKDIIDQVKDYLIMAVLYAHGEPLLYKDLGRAIHYASERHIATLISTNGILLNDANISQLLTSGLDFIKIVISGFTQKTHRIQNVRSNISHVKNSTALLAQRNRKEKHRLIIMVDYILYDYNVHEIDAARQFCRNIGVFFNIRPGNERRQDTGQPVSQKNIRLPLVSRCDWPWKVLMVNWNGDLLACCDYALWGSAQPYARFIKGKTNIRDVWNGKEAINNRLIHLQKGRQAIPICAQCTRQGTAFAK